MRGQWLNKCDTQNVSTFPAPPHPHSNRRTTPWPPTDDINSNVNAQSPFAERRPMYSVASTSTGAGGGGIFSGAGAVMEGMLGYPDQQLEQKACGASGGGGDDVLSPTQFPLAAAWQTAGMSGGAKPWYAESGWDFRPNGGTSTPNSHSIISTPSPDLASSTSPQECGNLVSLMVGRGDGTSESAAATAAAAGRGRTIHHLCQPQAVHAFTPGIVDYALDAGGVGGGLNVAVIGSPEYTAGLGGMGNGGLGGGGSENESVPELGLYSSQLAAQRVMSDDRVAVTAISNAEWLEAEERRQWLLQQQETAVSKRE